jgi:hypothetical protein
MRTIKKVALSLFLASILFLSGVSQAWAFCGFYVAGAETKLFNQASQVIIAHKDNQTVLTMANDFQGAVKDFALVVPVPVAIKRDQVKVGKKVILDKLDAFSQPRLVEYFDRDPCLPDAAYNNESRQQPLAPAPSAMKRRQRSSNGDLGVTIEDKFKVNEYEILILSAKESGGLETWLLQNGYKLPVGAREVLRPYIRQQMKFFVAKVDLQEFEKSGSNFLRPLQISYQSPKFMLPIRLGMLNAKGEQDLVVFLLSPRGRIELVNYRTVKIPTDTEIPEFVKDVFGGFYKDTFRRAYERENKKVAFLEYAWDVSNCDPCSSEPPTTEELKEAGVFWLNDQQSISQSQLWRGRRPTASNTFITRLHVRYTRDRFAEDLVFQETSNRDSFQGRYVMNHPVRGELKCAAAKDYRKTVFDRQSKEAQNLASMTGWGIEDIKIRIKSMN